MTGRRFAARLGAVAGWLTLAGILAFSVVGPQLVGGPRVSGTLDPTVISAYYSRPGLAIFSLGEFVTIFLFTLFVVALYQALQGSDQAGYAARVGLAFALAQIPLIISKAALSAALVSGAGAREGLVALFRFSDVLYNGGVYVTEAGFTAAFALAMRGVRGFPRWLPAVGVIIGLLQVVNMTSLFLGIPDAATLPGNLGVAVWFAGSSLGLGRYAVACESAPM